MKKITRLIIALSTAISIGLIPNAAAQTSDANAGIPYEISFNGSFYPDGLERIEYPFIAASQQRDGECLLNVISDDLGNVTSMSIVSCSDDLFKGAATRYINGQNFEQGVTSGLTVHNLLIGWDIGVTLNEKPLQLATR